MNEPENFVSRWSRRKRQAEREANQSASPQEDLDTDRKDTTQSAMAPEPSVSSDEDGPDAGAKQQPASEQNPPFDLSALPSIDSITAQTDIRVFLQKGVPAELTRAALRRAWVADPNIRDFIEIAENQWDFATGADLPGFGSLEVTPDEIRKMVAEVFGEVVKPSIEAETAGQSPAGECANPEETEPSSAVGDLGQPAGAQVVATVYQDQIAAGEAVNERTESIVHRNEDDGASQQSRPGSSSKSLHRGRAHGRALPQ